MPKDKRYSLTIWDIRTLAMAYRYRESVDVRGGGMDGEGEAVVAFSINGVNYTLRGDAANALWELMPPSITIKPLR